MVRMPLTRLDLDSLHRMAKSSSCGPLLETSSTSFRSTVPTRSHKVPSSFFDELQVLFSPLEEQQGFRTCEIGINEGSSTPLEWSKIPPPSRPSFLPLSLSSNIQVVAGIQIVVGPSLARGPKVISPK